MEGVEYWVSAWKRAPDANPKAPALSFRLTKKEEVHKQGYQQAQQAVTMDDMKTRIFHFNARGIYAIRLCFLLSTKKDMV